jgi:hypothetical protein
VGAEYYARRTKRGQKSMAEKILPANKEKYKKAKGKKTRKKR